MYGAWEAPLYHLPLQYHHHRHIYRFSGRQAEFPSKEPTTCRLLAIRIIQAGLKVRL